VAIALGLIGQKEPNIEPVLPEPFPFPPLEEFPGVSIPEMADNQQGKETPDPFPWAHPGTEEMTDQAPIADPFRDFLDSLSRFNDPLSVQKWKG
jgi:hypothetical protein